MSTTSEPISVHFLSYDQLLKLGRLDSFCVKSFDDDDGFSAFDSSFLRIRHMHEIFSFVTLGTVESYSAHDGKMMYRLVMEENLYKQIAYKQNVICQSIPLLSNDLIVLLSSHEVFLTQMLEARFSSDTVYPFGEKAFTLLLRVHEGHSVRFFQYFLQTHFFRQKLSYLQQYSLALDFIDHFKNLQVTIPTIEKQREFAQILVQAEVESDMLKHRAVVVLRQASENFERLVTKTQLSLKV